MAPSFDDVDLSFPAIFSSNPVAEAGRDERAGPSAHHAATSSSSTHHQSRSKQRLGQYTVIKTLGEGSFGKVKLAVHQVSGQRVALKIISRRKLINRDMAGRVEREIQYLQLLRHPHIIKLYTVITTTSEIIMVLEYAGGELFNYIVAHGKVTEATARRFFQQMICAVEYCHRHKIVHRDLKPENLLLDDQLNVKIADFGLSNIMTDGNFLKTSCGSPNYAAPEVISGKLYAGPEVDVWSCGVILYVLLCGGLPFDDEYIPALFKKIAQGNYTIPSYVASGPANLIRRMLVVNAVHRITVQEIRQDPWFMKDLADYLQPPVEDFIDTGVDPNKAINPRALAPGKPTAVQERIHEDVVGKLGKTMGYAKGDVQDALGKDEPSAIKDAYLIVRENQIMATNPASTDADDIENAFGQSPPLASTPDQSLPLRSLAGTSKTGRALSSAGKDVDGNILDGPTSEGSEGKEGKIYKSSIAILPNSMPTYHHAYMVKLRAGHTESPSTQRQVRAETVEQSAADQAATARSLKPHARSQLNSDQIDQKPESLTPLPAKKPRQLRWQFGIRSRNPPLDAMHCLYRALRKAGAEWEEPEMDEPSWHGTVDVGSDMTEAEWSGDDLPSEGRPQRVMHRPPKVDERVKRGQRGPHQASSEVGPYEHAIESTTAASSDDSIPPDPFLIRCRWMKDGMRSSATTQSGSSSRGSKGSLTIAEPTNKAGHSSAGSRDGHSSLASAPGSPLVAADSTERVYVYMDIQLYQIDRDFYLVDFKCAGYERAVEETIESDGSSSDAHMVETRSEAGPSRLQTKKTKTKTQKRGLGRRFAEEEKKVSSPFPFLDLTSRLIVALAEGDN